MRAFSWRDARTRRSARPAGGARRDRGPGDRRSAARRAARDEQPAACGAGEADPPRPRNSVAARQRRDAPRQARGRRRRRDLAGGGGARSAGDARRRHGAAGRDCCFPPHRRARSGSNVAADDDGVRALLAAIDHAPTHRAVAAERAFLAALGGDCRSPVAAHAHWRDDGTLRLDAEIFSDDGAEHAAGHVLVAATGAAGELAHRLLGEAPESVRRLFAA